MNNLSKQIITLTIMCLAFFMQQTWALDNPSFEANANDSQKGTLTMNELFVGGIKRFKNVQIEFDFNKSTFNVLSISEADTSIPLTAVETFDADGVSVGLRGCISENRTVTCHFFLTSNEFDRSIIIKGEEFFQPSSSAFDDLGNQYFPSKVTIANKTDRFDSFQNGQTLIADLTVDATIVFSNLSSRADNFSLLSLGLSVDNVTQQIEFRKVPF